MTDQPSTLTIEDSGRVTRAAVGALIGGEVPDRAEIAGRSVRLTGEIANGRLSVMAEWDDGHARFSVQGGDASIERRSPIEDRGHRYSVSVHSELGQREIAWLSLEWVVRDAIRAGERSVDVSFTHAYLMRDRDEHGNLLNAAIGARSRELAEQSGLSGEARVPMGSFELTTSRWHPSESEVLRRMITLAVIKAHFLDRGEGRLFAGQPLFSITAGVDDQPPTAPPMPGPRRDLSGVHPWFGGMAAQLDGLLDLLDHVQEEAPPEVQLQSWLADRGKLTVGRYPEVLARVPLHLGLTEVHDGRWQLTSLGLELLESRDPELAYRTFAATYVGFDQTLAYIGSHPGAGGDELHEYLGQVLTVQWKSAAQPVRRANWLVAFGLAESDRGRFVLTERGHRVLQAVGGEILVDPGEEEDDEPEIEEEGSPVLDPTQVDVRELILPTDLLAQCCAALNAGKHLMLVGPPGTGKSTLGSALGQLAAEVYGLGPPLLATASADWTTYDTIGGWTQRSDQTLTFREGVVTRALKEKRWLVLDEVNRADIDKSFGELFTVLAGGTVTTAYTRVEDEREVPVRIGPDASPYNLGPWFRIIATMNLRDKASLFRLSYAFMRRFAVITVPGLGDPQLTELARRDGGALGLDDDAVALATRAVSRQHGLSRFVDLGPSMLRDVLAYVGQRSTRPAVAVAEGIELFVLPQLEGLEDAAARDLDAVLGDLFGMEPSACTRLRDRFQASYPHIFR